MPPIALPDTPQCAAEACAMGVSSSQPEHSTPEQGAPFSAAPCTPSTPVSSRRSPGMDDTAAEQQLMSESATSRGVAHHYHDGQGANGSRIGKPISPRGEAMGPDRATIMADAASPSLKQLAARRKRKSDTTRPRKSQRQKATETWKLRSFELATLQSYVDGDVGALNGQGVSQAEVDNGNEASVHRIHDAAIQVPDSQLVPIVDNAPLSPPMTSSVAIPASMPELPCPSRKATREEDNVVREISPVLEINHSQDTGGGTRDPGPPSTSSSQRSLSRNEDRPLEETDEAALLDEVAQVDVTQEADNQETDIFIAQPPVARKLKSQRSFPSPCQVEAGVSSSQKRQRKLRRTKSSHFEETVEDPTEESAKDGYRSNNSSLAKSIQQVPREGLPSVRKAKRRRSKEEAAQIAESPAASLQNPSEQILPKVGLSSSLLRKPQKSEVCDWQVWPSKNTESRLDVVGFDKRNIDSTADPAQAEGVATDNASVKDVQGTDVAMPYIDEQSDEHMDVDHLRDGDTENHDAKSSTRLVSNKGDQKTTKRRRSKTTAKRKSGISPKQPRKPEDRKVFKKKNLNTITAAEEALQNVRDLPINPDKRTSGDFTADEEEIIRRAICDYQQMRGWEVSDIVKVIQWTANDSKDQLHASIGQDLDIRYSESQEFWDDMNRTLMAGTLTRSLDAVRKHIRSRYHEFKRGGWTREEDDELLRCFEAAPRQWKAIGSLLGRSKTDVHSRWSEYLQHRDQRQYGRWTDTEEAELIRAVNTVAQRDEDALHKAGHLPREEYTAESINWSQVVAEMGNTRGRLQVSVKWKKMMARNNPPAIRVQIKPRGANAKPIPTSTPSPRVRTRTGSALRTRGLTSKRARRQKKVEPATPMSQQPNTRSIDHTVGVATMLWGDKLDLVGSIAMAGYEKEEDIDWEATATELKHIWSVRTLQAALQDLLAVVGTTQEAEKRPSLQDDLDLVIDYLEYEHGGELAQHYNPYDFEIESAGGHDEDTTGTIPHTTGKRKMVARDSLPESQPVFQKKRKTTVPGDAKAHGGQKPKVSTASMAKSKEIITESDEMEADSEAEL
ncbi:hypothetical protein J1614_010446 [Plenodomus biglobosus]|nr:hypothetical protein J1614_010446 [Plenodomus biglobosus]